MAILLLLLLLLRLLLSPSLLRSVVVAVLVDRDAGAAGALSAYVPMSVSRLGLGPIVVWRGFFARHRGAGAQRRWPTGAGAVAASGNVVLPLCTFARVAAMRPRVRRAGGPRRRVRVIAARAGPARGGGLGRLLRLRGQRLLGEPGVMQRLVDGHARLGVEVHEPQDEVLRLRGQGRAPTLLREQLREHLALEQFPVGIVLIRVRAMEHGPRHKQEERAPTQAPCVHLRGQVWRSRVQLRRPELLPDEAMEGHGVLGACRSIVGNLHRLAWIAQADLPLVVAVHEEQHVLKRDILHRQASLVQTAEPLRGLPYQHLRLALVQTPGALLQRLKEVSACGELGDDVVAMLVAEVILHLDDMLEASDDVVELHLAERDLADLHMLRVPKFVDQVRLDHLQGKFQARRDPYDLPDVPEDRLLQMLLDSVGLSPACDLLADEARALRGLRRLEPLPDDLLHQRV
mmetsp:Transcript_48749/g.140194  ORF Transcript_48749/g.140194 Transcript_48749/m.140194 type:complete len:459 (-) Transcript_48749:1540-2916(-)